MQIVTATELKRNMKQIFERAIANKTPVIIKRPHGHHIAIIELSAYQSLKETAYLLHNQANAAHLTQSLKQLQSEKTVKKNLEDL